MFIGRALPTRATALTIHVVTLTSSLSRDFGRWLKHVLLTLENSVWTPNDVSATLPNTALAGPVSACVLITIMFALVYSATASIVGATSPRSALAST